MICLYEKELQVMCNKINWNILSHMTIIFFSKKKITRENIKTKGNYQIHQTQDESNEDNDTDDRQRTKATLASC